MEFTWKTYCFLMTCLITLNAGIVQAQPLRTFRNELLKHGQPPLDFVNRLLEKHDLIIFDDALHTALEPFLFYNTLIDQHLKGRNKITHIFLEVLSSGHQERIDRYLNAKVKDSSILIPIFQDDYSGFGLRSQTYLDLFEKVWDTNRLLPQGEKIRLIGLDMPIDWSVIRTESDYAHFQESLDPRDYYLYLQILKHLQNFKFGKKGIFLTNTRHAYKKIRHQDGSFYMNAATFFHINYPIKSYSIRFNNLSLSVSGSKDSPSRVSTQGMERFEYKWAKTAEGKWDGAFEQSGYAQLAIPLEGNSFGKTPYIGNHMLDVLKGTSMKDAYDAVIFLDKIDRLRSSAKFDFIYTTSFRPEMERRLRIVFGDGFAKFLESSGHQDFDAYYRSLREKIRPL